MMLYTITNSSISLIIHTFDSDKHWENCLPFRRCITCRWMCTVYIHSSTSWDLLPWGNVLSMETLHEKTCLVLCVSWGVGLLAQGNKLKRLFMLSSLMMFVTRHLSFSPFNNRDSNSVPSNNNKFVPTRPKPLKWWRKNKHSRRQKKIKSETSSWKRSFISNERISNTTAFHASLLV